MLIDTRTGKRLRMRNLGGQMTGAVRMDEAIGTAYFGASHSSTVHAWTRVAMGE